jgi:hypothetical protein
LTCRNERIDLQASVASTSDCYLGAFLTVIVEGLTALRGELRKAAATPIPINCRLSKAAVDKEGSVGVVLVGVVAIPNVESQVRTDNIGGVALASRNIVDVPWVPKVFGAEVDVVAISIFFAIPPTSTASIGRTTFADIFQTSHVGIVEPSWK